MRHKTTQEPPVVLPVGFNAWLLECVPVPGCATCQTERRCLTIAKEAGDIDQAAKHAAKVREHAAGGH